MVLKLEKVRHTKQDFGSSRDSTLSPREITTTKLGDRADHTKTERDSTLRHYITSPKLTTLGGFYQGQSINFDSAQVGRGKRLSINSITTSVSLLIILKSLDSNFIHNIHSNLVMYSGPTNCLLCWFISGNKYALTISSIHILYAYIVLKEYKDN